jgi:predicted kinase
VQTFLCGEYGRFASTLAQRLGTALQGEVVREDYLVMLKNILA